jgi:glycosyltransferase involved in cell wall biosynthesis
MKAHFKSKADFTITACTIAKNEEKTLATSINSYKKYVDEIIIVDTGSTDKTVEIAKSLGAKVLHFDWCNDFAAAKNVALEAATGDWIVFLDADEYFAEDTCKDLRAVIFAAIDDNKNAVGCRMENIDKDNDSGIVDGFSIRVFKAGMRYEFAIHEEIRNPGGINVLTVDKTYFYLKHTGYSTRIISDKCKRNLDIMLKELKTEEDYGRVITYYSYISDAYYGLGKLKKSREYAKKFIEESERNEIRIIGCETRPYINIIKSLELEMADPESITPYVLKFEEKFSDSPDASMMGAVDCMRRFLFNDALKKFREAFEKSENYGGTSVDSVTTHKVHFYNNCGNCEEALLHSADAMNWYFKAFNEPDGYQAALFNLLRIVRQMPQKEIDSLVESLYMGKSQKVHLAVMSALMCNYMAPQLIKCYAAYRTATKSDQLNADITAFIMAGQGKFETSASLFYLNSKANYTKEAAMRSLLFAAISGEEERISEALQICNAIYAFALGFVEKARILTKDLFLISNVYLECSRAGQNDFAKEKLSDLALKLSNKQLLRLSTFLSESFAFELALHTARLVDISPESIFMQGYCLYRMHRLREAEELLLLAKHMGYSKPGLEAIYNNIDVIRGKVNNEPDAIQKAKLKAQIVQEIQTGNYAEATGNITTFMRIAEPDTEMFSALASLLYYSGDYTRSAIAAECGLLKDENNFDLLYNAGCAYEKIDNKRRAKSMYLKALKNCGDEDLAIELRQVLEVLMV